MKYPSETHKNLHLTDLQPTVESNNNQWHVQ